MTGKVIEKSANSLLILIVPFAFLIVLLFKAWFLLLTLLILAIAWRVWETYQWQKWSQQINPFFNQLIKENQGCLTPLDLSIKANLSGNAAKQFLEKKAEEFGAQRQDIEAKGTVYYFLTASALGSIFDDSEPLTGFEDEPDISDEPTLLEPSQLQEVAINNTPPELVNDESIEVPEEKPWDVSTGGALIQAELARRLNIHSGTITKHKGDPEFSAWTKSYDPDGIAWEYSEEAKGYVPVSSN